MKRLVCALITTNVFTLLVLKITSPNNGYCVPHVKERKACPTDPAISVGMETTKPAEVAQATTKLTGSTTLIYSYVTEELELNYSAPHLPVIFVVTPTHTRETQKADLTSMCHTLMHVPRLVWVVVEDSPRKTPLVTRLLSRCRVSSVHLNTITIPMNLSVTLNTSSSSHGLTNSTNTTIVAVHHRGVAQRNLGLGWIRRHCLTRPCRGVVYFGDDDNKYDLRLFVEMRKTVGVSVFTVAFAGGLLFEGPYCSSSGNITKWHVVWVPSRKIPIDMAGFAVNVEVLMKNRYVWMGRMEGGQVVRDGFLESEFLSQFVTRKDLECRSYEKEILVWHTKTAKPNIANEAVEPSDPNFEI
ncbi:hypothetical protein EMCRGX_G014774 [Ephydatia muelleri]